VQPIARAEHGIPQLFAVVAGPRSPHHYLCQVAAPSFGAFPPQPWNDQTPEKLLASHQAVNAMQRAIETLPVTLKEVLILRDVEGVDAKEVCELLKITETNLYVRLHRARERVRAAVEIYLEGGK